MAASSSTTMGASAYSGAREPTKDEWDSMDNLQDIFTWAKIKGSVDYPPSQQATLLAALGADPDATIDEVAAIPEDLYLAAINDTWEHSASAALDDGQDTDVNIKAAPILKGRAISAHYAARIWSGVETTRGHKIRRTLETEDAAQAYRNAKLIALQATAESQKKLNDGVETVPINEVADTTLKREVAVMPMERYHLLYKNYKKWMHMDPKEEHTPSPVQLSVLAAIIKSGTCYVDLGLWGAHQGRTARAMRCEGLIPGPHGTMVHADFRGPPDFETWNACFIVYVVAMIMLEQVLPPWLFAYIDLIALYNGLYGRSNWAFLYQTDVRFRSERLPAMAMRESDRLEAAMKLGSTTEYDADKPWDYLWKLASDRNEGRETRWWYCEFERKCTVPDANTNKLIEGDAKVAPTIQAHFASSHNATNIMDRDREVRTHNGGGSGRTNTGGGKRNAGSGGGSGGGGGGPKATPPPPSSQPMTKTPGKKGRPICQGYNTGACPGHDGKACPFNSTRRHLCHWCAAPHPAVNCRKKDPNAGGKPKGNKNKDGR
jgi:uncharacterized membrane protein YgcG